LSGSVEAVSPAARSRSIEALRRVAKARREKAIVDLHRGVSVAGNRGAERLDGQARPPGNPERNIRPPPPSRIRDFRRNLLKRLDSEKEMKGNRPVSPAFHGSEAHPNRV